MRRLPSAWRRRRALTGLLVAETDSAITLRIAGGDETTVQRGNIRSMTMGAHSLMPQEPADLIAFFRR